MNYNEEFITNATIQITEKLNLVWEQQKLVREILNLSLYNYEVVTLEKSLVKGDIKEKVALYLKVRKLDGLSESTLKHYFYILRAFCSYLNKPIATITINDLRMFIYEYSKGKKPSTQNTITSCIKAFFSWLEQEELVPKNPAKRLEQNKLPIRLRKSLTVRELEQLRLACITNRERALLEFIFSTGCRISEVESINIEDLDLCNNTLRVVGKGNKERLVCFSDKTKLHLENYLKERRDGNPALFISKRFPYERMGKRGLEIVISKIGKRAGFEKRIFPHLLRHTMATLGLQSGAEITTIQHLLGHTDPATTEIYAELNQENIQHQYKQHFIH